MFTWVRFFPRITLNDFGPLLYLKSISSFFLFPSGWNIIIWDFSLRCILIYGAVSPHLLAYDLNEMTIRMSEQGNLKQSPCWAANHQHVVIVSMPPGLFHGYVVCLVFSCSLSVSALTPLCFSAPGREIYAVLFLLVSFGALGVFRQ